MLLIAPGDAVATHRSRRSEHRSAPADFIATAQRGELANAAQPLPAPCFEDSPLPTMVMQVLAGLALWALFGWGAIMLLAGWLA